MNNNSIEILIHSYLNGSISQKEKDELFTWLVEKPENVTYFNQLSDIWLSSSVFQEMHDFDADEAYDRVKARINYVNTEVPVRRPKTILLNFLKVAAILIPVVILSGLATKLLFPEKKEYAHTPILFEVPYGSKATVNLSDGSKVVLNAGSKLTIDEGFGESHRNLNLTGEGYFVVAKNEKLPLIVHAGGLDVRAIGTEFNVKAYPEDKIVETVLVHGSIQVKKTTFSGSAEEPLVLFPKQSLVYNKGTDKIQVNFVVEKNKQENLNSMQKTLATSKVIFKKAEIDPTIYTSWKEASWTIYDLKFSDLAKELERKYDIEISFKSETLKNMKFTGTLPDISLEQVLFAMRLISPIEYKINGKQVELTENENLLPAYKKYYRNTE